jgi:hypothetical protein
MSAPREMKARILVGSVISPPLYNRFVNVPHPPPPTPGVHLVHCTNCSCLHATGQKEEFVLRKLQRGLSSKETCVGCRILN